VASLSWLLR